jgi:hypothetical protein
MASIEIDLIGVLRRYMWLQTVGCSPCDNPLVQPQYDGSLGGFNASRSNTLTVPADPELRNNLTYSDGSWAAGSYVKDTVKLGKYCYDDVLFRLLTSICMITLP